MQPTTKTVLLFFIALITLPACNQDKSTSDSIAIGTTESIYSATLKEERKVLVHVPEGYNQSDSVKYPVLYLLDGDAHFKSVVGLMHQLSSVNGNSVCPRMVIVAIPNTNRTRDLTPTHVVSKKADSTFFKSSGGGENFTAFIAEELIPFIDRKYPVTQKRTLVGHSLGGLMVINTLLKHSDLFDKYICIDPSLWWNNFESLQAYEVAVEQNELNGKSLFIGIANTIRMDTLTALEDTTESTDHFRAIHRFIKTLKQTKTHRLDWQAKYYPDETHGSVPLISEYDAFHFLFRKIPIAMGLSQLKQFEGKYKHQFEKGEDSFLDIVANENFLVITETWRGREMVFSPVGESDFYSFENDFPVTFKKNANGGISQLVAFERDVWEKVE